MLITISGLPGSGTSTLARLVSSALGIERLDGGQVFRAMAAERGLDVHAFGQLAEGHDAIDRELDARLAARARAGDVVLESRLAGWIATHEGLDALRVWIACDERVRAARVGDREAADAEAALAQNRAREASEQARYRAYYGIDVFDLSIYELILDSATDGPDRLCADIVGRAGPDRPPT